METKRLVIKICGMRQPENIRAVDALQPDYLGFIFYPRSPRFVSADCILPETRAKKTGVFVNEPVEQMLETARHFHLQAIQLHGNESPETCRQLIQYGFEVIKAFRVDDETKPDELEAYRENCNLFLFDTKSTLPGGTGKKFNWEKLEELAFIGPFLLSGGIGPKDASDIATLTIPNLYGIDINSRFETEPGMKNVSWVGQFLAQLREAHISIKH